MGQYTMGLHLFYIASDMVIKFGEEIIWAVFLWILFVANMFGDGLLGGQHSLHTSTCT